jgi:formylglycine-generating enzyme required for sulfatase activity
VQGDYKFCPECAYRLRPGSAATEPEPGAGGRHWTWLLALCGLLLLVGGYFVGRQDDPEEPDVTDRGERYLTVQDIAEHLVRIEPGVATYQEEIVFELPELEEAIQRFWSDVAEESAPALIEHAVAQPGTMTRWERLLTALYERTDALLEEKQRHVEVRTDAFYVMLHEVSRGQYAEFLRAVQANPELITARWGGIVELVWRPSDLAYARYYWERWWQQVAEYHREVLGRTIERPSWLGESATRLSDSQGTLLLVPPSWVREEMGGFTWELASGTEDLPVTGISWWDADLFAGWASDTLSITLRLPTEPQWLRAYHGGYPTKPADDFSPRLEGRKWPWGNDLVDDRCNHLTFPPNGQLVEDGKTVIWEPQLRSVRKRYGWQQGRTLEGVLNMAGNAAEWTRNWRPVRSEGVTDGPYRVQANEDRLPVGDEPPTQLDEAPTQGGSYTSGIEECSVFAQLSRHKADRADDVGFRLVVEAGSFR